jgi:hypothetical protein
MPSIRPVLWSVTTDRGDSCDPERSCEVGKLVLPWEVVGLEGVRAPFQMTSGRRVRQGLFLLPCCERVRESACPSVRRMTPSHVFRLVHSRLRVLSLGWPSKCVLFIVRFLLILCSFSVPSVCIYITLSEGIDSKSISSR